MRQRFEQQLEIDQIAIADAEINMKSKNALDELQFALQVLFCNNEYSEKLFGILESHICHGKKKTGRQGMDLLQIFVLAQVRLCKTLATATCSI